MVTEVPEAAAAPNPIFVDPGMWDLRASPGTLSTAADAWRSLQEAAESAEDTVSGHANGVLHGGRWTGDTAESFDDHQAKVCGDVEDLAGAAERVADLLDELATVLTVNQDRLTELRNGLAGVPATQGQLLVFHPEDEAQAKLVRDARDEALEVRDHVDGVLAARESRLVLMEHGFGRLTDNWPPRTVGMLNLNIGQGYKNEPFFMPDSGEGTDHGDIADIAQIIADADVDIVTMQEIFGVEAENLEQQLQELTGDEWTVYYGEASTKPYWSDGIIPRGMNESFGNAIAVRHGGAIESSEHVATHDLNAPGDTIITPEGEITDGEERSALQVEITFAGR